MANQLTVSYLAGSAVAPALSMTMDLTAFQLLRVWLCLRHVGPAFPENCIWYLGLYAFPMEQKRSFSRRRDRFGIALLATPRSIAKGMFQLQASAAFESVGSNSLANGRRWKPSKYFMIAGQFARDVLVIFCQVVSTNQVGSQLWPLSAFQNTDITISFVWRRTIWLYLGF